MKIAMFAIYESFATFGDNFLVINAKSLGLFTCIFQVIDVVPVKC